MCVCVSENVQTIYFLMTEIMSLFSLHLSSYIIPFLENYLGHSAQNKSTSVSDHFPSRPILTTLYTYLDAYRSHSIVHEEKVTEFIGTIFI